MKIGIIGAMEEEVTLLRDKIENRQTISLGGCEIYTGQLNGTEVALLKSGIGKVAAALGATLLLEHCKPDVIINTGSAGGLAPTLKVAISLSRTKRVITTRMSRHLVMNTVSYQAVRQALKLTIN